MKIDLKGHSVLSLCIHKTRPFFQAVMCSCRQAKKKPHRYISKKPHFGFVALLSSEGIEFWRICHEAESLTSDLSTDHANSLNWSSRVPTEPQTLGLVSNIPKSASATADTNPDLICLTTPPYYFCRVVSNLSELWASPGSHAQVLTLRGSLRGYGIKSLSAKGRCWHVIWFCTQSAAENLGSEGMWPPPPRWKLSVSFAIDNATQQWNFRGRGAPASIGEPFSLPLVALKLWPANVWPTAAGN